MTVAEFQLRAWQTDSTHAQVLVHTSPAGETRKPVITPLDLAALEANRQLFEQRQWFLAPAIRKEIAALGQRLTAALFPPEVYGLLTASLAQVPADAVLRIRLCLDEPLIDLPWEYLWRPDASDPTSLAGFLLTDSRISLVREAPRPLRNPSAPEGKQRMVFAGALWGRGGDRWQVKDEYADVASALSEIRDSVELGAFISAAGDGIEGALVQPAGIFHYSGHTDRAADGRTYLVRDVTDTGGRISFEMLYADQVAELLRRAGTRLACFSACNSGRWGFVKPLLAAGLPVLVGAQAATSTRGAAAFFGKLYGQLAAGLSFDEAVTGARLHVLNAAGFTDDASMEWGNFMVYMTASDPLLLPQSADIQGSRRRQQSARADRRHIATAVTKALSPAAPGPVDVNKRVLRRAIFEHFDLNELEVLCMDIEQDLNDAGIPLPVSVDTLTVQGEGLELVVGKLIEYLNRNERLDYLVKAVQRAKPGII